MHADEVTEFCSIPQSRNFDNKECVLTLPNPGNS